jgi:hypothetical protein
LVRSIVVVGEFAPIVVLVRRPSTEMRSSVSQVTLFRTICVAGSAMDCAATIPTMSLGRTSVVGAGENVFGVAERLVELGA